jgi:hypothetical protein
MDQLTKELVKHILEVDNSPKSICEKCGYEGDNDNHICEENKDESDPNSNINNNIENWDFEDYLKSLAIYCVEQGMNILPMPSLNMIDDNLKNASKILGTTGYYNPASKEITIFTAGRHPKDILRTLAHELIHHEQNLENRLHPISTTDTNADSKLSIIEDEAYLKGNRIFRHWEDQLKEKTK